MGELAIHVQNISKQYTIRVGTAPHSGMAATPSGLTNIVRHWCGLGTVKLHTEVIWPLSDVSFEVNRGEIVGIIGRNGAGKSTLLKILSRIIDPSAGRARIFGKVGSLLEVGTGFHPDLTGRENIYLSGTILGMKKNEIDRAFDAIVDFSGIERFLDTPVKRYSSGMYVRLAFAVGAHLNPDILIVDEVLAVGDGQFQKKCLNKMQDVGHQGRTVLFVSHNMPAVTRLCQRAILLDQGRVVKDGPVAHVVGEYVRAGYGARGSREWYEDPSAPSGEVHRLCAVRVRSDEGKITDTIDIRRPFHVEMEYDVLQPGHTATTWFTFLNEAGDCVFITVNLDPEWRGRPRPVGRYKSSAWIPGNFLAEGMLFVECASEIEEDKLQYQVQDAVAFQVVDLMEGDSARGDYTGEMQGAVRPLLKWTNELIGK